MSFAFRAYLSVVASGLLTVGFVACSFSGPTTDDRADAGEDVDASAAASDASTAADARAHSDAGQPDAAANTYLPGQCAQTTAGTVVSVSGQCEYCVETNCCPELGACGPGTDCKKYDQCDLACVQAAGSGGGNYQQCLAACTPAAGKATRQKLYECRATSCSSVCN